MAVLVDVPRRCPTVVEHNCLRSKKRALVTVCNNENTQHTQHYRKSVHKEPRIIRKLHLLSLKVKMSYLQQAALLHAGQSSGLHLSG